METDYTLKAMESCDFSAPLSVTIIEDDSDEDTKDNLDLYEHDNYFNCPTPKLYMDTEVDDKSKSIEEETDRTDKRSTVTQNLETLIGKLRKDKKNCVKETSIKNKKKKSKNKKEKKIKPPKHSAFITQKDRNLEPIEAYTEISSATEKIKTKSNDRLEKRINSNVTSEDDIKKIDGNNQETNGYVNDLLAKVSESLLYVLDAYYNHLDNVINKPNDLWYVQESKRRYTRIKQHFYQLSYCTTNIVILAQENNTKFTEEFLKNTVKLSEVRNNKKITIHQIQPLYYEMLSWAKQKKELHSIPVTPVITNNKSSPLLCKQLREPPRLPTSVQYPPKSNNFSVPKVSILNDSHNREIRISLEPNPPQGNNETQPNHIPCNIVAKPVEKLIQREYYETEKRYEIFDSLRSSQLQMHNANYDTRKHFRSSISEVTSSTANVYKNNFIDQNRCTVANCHYLEQHQHSTDATNPMNMRFPHPKPPSLPTYEQAFYWNSASVHKTNENQPAKNIEYSNTNAQTNIDTSRSSVSTDSGFISPQQLISPMDMENTVSEEMQHAQVTPLITHVTSLNPTALQILEHSCHICGATTNKKCLGCYHVYYCSYQCQRMDWNNHMALCKAKAWSRATSYIPNNVKQ